MARMPEAMAADDEAWRRLGRFVRSERAAADLSQDQVAQRAGISITTLRRVEKVQGPVTEDTLGDIEQALGLSAGALVSVMDGSALSERLRALVARQRALTDELDVLIRQLPAG
jgi:transcriptional regulator with XRE-family HTH domain